MKNYHITKKLLTGAVAGLMLAGLSSCWKEDENSPGYEFMPDMYRSPSLEYYSVHTIDGDTVKNALLPVKGTVPRGYLPYMYPNTAEGYEQATMNLHNPLPAADKDKWSQEGEVLYGKFCVHCHGASGAGDGKVAEKLPGPPPAYGSIKDLTEGKIFHTITYGKGTMGPHSSLLTQEERWKLVYYVQKLKEPAGGAQDSAKAAAPEDAKLTAEKMNNQEEGKKN